MSTLFLAKSNLLSSHPLLKLFRKEQILMSLYANYMPEPEQQDLTLSQAARIESRQENLQAQY